MKFYIIDCFAEEKYSGNELLVVLPDKIISDDEQQKIAREINFSETVFIFPKDNASDGYNVRIWTPTTGEVPFAGHPSLGAAYVIHNYIENHENSKIILNTKVGQIPITVSDDIYTMKQNPPSFKTVIKKHQIAEIFQINDSDIRDDIPIQWVSTGLEAVIIPLKTKNALNDVNINQDKFKEYVSSYPECNCNHMFFVDMGQNIFSARCIMEDFVEDPATGSAVGCMAGYLLKYNYFNADKISYTVHQGEKLGRNSVLYVKAHKATNDTAIYVGGKCHTVAHGEWE